jgi:hypothetical protein
MALGWLLFGGREAAGPTATILSAAVLVLGGALLEGGVVGYAQASVLVDAISGMTARHWVAATVVGAALAWFLGMVPSTAMALLESEPAAGEAAAGPEGAPLLLVAAALGLVAGPVLGTPQFLVLRRWVRRAAVWILANALAWAVGMVVVFAGAGSLSEDATPMRVVLTVAVSCLGAGALVGAVHGLFLVRLLGNARALDEG